MPPPVKNQTLAGHSPLNGNRAQGWHPHDGPEEVRKEDKHKARLASMGRAEFKNPPSETLVWKEPSITEKQLQDLAADGVLPKKSLGKWRAPNQHRTPMPNPGEIVLFKAFVERGLGLPTSDFFRRLLHFYGLTVNHLTPNAVFIFPSSCLYAIMRSISWNLPILHSFSVFLLG